MALLSGERRREREIEVDIQVCATVAESQVRVWALTFGRSLRVVAAGRCTYVHGLFSHCLALRTYCDYHHINLPVISFARFSFSFI